MIDQSILNMMSHWKDEAKNIRQYIHKNPEVGFTEFKTQELIIKLLSEYGVDEINSTIGTTGVVAVIKGHKPGKSIGFRADIDALPIKEENTFAHSSIQDGVMHACGHDGHTTMLLIAAKYLCQNRDFCGKAILIFQPAEEGLGGAKSMIKDGILEAYPISAIYALHNMPGIRTGNFAFKTGAIMASSDRFYIHIQGEGGHAAIPQTTKDPLLATTFIYQGIQAFVARTFNPMDSVVVSVTQIHCGDASNVIANDAYMVGTFRTHSPKVREKVIEQFNILIPNMAAAFGVCASFKLGDISHPVTQNSSEETQRAIQVAKNLFGSTNVDSEVEALMASEDFSFFLEKVPGCYGFIGNGNSFPLHNNKYDFNDDILLYGAAYFVKIMQSYHY